MQDWGPIKNKLKNLLCPAGDGVFAVTSKASLKSSLQKTIYNVPPAKVRDKWEEKLSQPPDKMCLLGIASDCGGGILRGTNWGPLYLRDKMYEIYEDIYDLGDIRVIPQLLLDEYLNTLTIQKCREALYGDKNIEYPVSPLSIAQVVMTALYEYNDSLKILAFGGDHSISYPLVKSYLEFKQAKNPNVAIVHFDAHTDLLESRLGLPITFGSWVYHVLPQMPNNKHFVQIGIRASNYSKNYWEDKYGIKQFWAKEIIAGEVNSNDIIEYLKKLNVDEIYISFDVDAMDQKFVAATGTAEPDGLWPDVTYQLLHELVKNFSLTGADLVEVAPLISVNQRDQTMAISQKIMSILYQGML